MLKMEYKDISHIEFYHLETSKAIFWNNGEFVYFYDDAVNNLLNSDTVIKDNKQNNREEKIRIYKA